VENMPASQSHDLCNTVITHSAEEVGDFQP
jgi:hypothetical protein